METVVRVLIVYLVVTAGLRLVGKRAFGHLSPADLVVLMLIPEFFSQAISLEDFSLTNAIVAVSTLLVAVVITDTLGYRFERFGRVISGGPVTIAGHGRLRTDRLDRERLGPDELLDAMHRAGLETIDQVRWAVLYPDGSIAIIPARGPGVPQQPPRADPI